MRSLSNTINLLLVSMFMLAPFVGYILRTGINSDFNNIVTFLAVLIAVVLLLLRAKLNFPKHLGFLLLFSLYIIYSDLYIANKDFNFKYVYQNDILGSFLILFIIENTYFPKKFMDLAMKVSVVILLIAFIVILYQQFVNILFFVDPKQIPTLTTSIFSETRLPSIYSWIGGLFIMGLCFFPVLAIIIADALKNDKKFITIYYVMGAITAFMSKSRYIMLNFLFIVFLIPLYRKVDLLKIIKFAAITVSICFLLYIGAKQVGYNIDTIINERILETQSQDIRHSTAGTRLLAIQIFKKLFPENPLFGKGRTHYDLEDSKDTELLQELQGRSSQIHVGYLSLLYYYGIVGGGLYLAFVGSMLMNMFRTAKITWQWGPLFGFAQLVIYNITGVILNFMVMGIVICFVFDKYYRDTIEDTELAPANNLSFAGND